MASRTAPHPAFSFGGLYLRFRQWSEHGLVTAYYRDVVRPQILKTAPIVDTTDGTCEVHVMTCRNDWLNAIWTLKSFYRFSGRHYALCIHEDGTVPRAGLDQLRDHFPAARLITKSEADAWSEVALRDYPRCKEFRRSNVLGPKLFDCAGFLRSERMLLLDSDLLFFKEPTELLKRIDDPSYRKNTFNADCGHGYTVHPAEVRDRIGHELLPFINSGLGLVQKDSLRADWCEDFLTLPGILEGHFWRIEQTLIALCSSRFGAELLPEEYTLHLGRGIGNRPFRHYVGRIRHLMYCEGIQALVRQEFLRASQ